MTHWRAVNRRITTLVVSGRALLASYCSQRSGGIFDAAQDDDRAVGVEAFPVYPASPSQRTLPVISKAQSGAAIYSPSSRSLARMRACTIALLSADLAAFVAATLLASAISGDLTHSPYIRAFENVARMGTAWHGWGTFLVLVSCLSYLGGRGHYTVRVPSWTQLGDVAVGTAVALACDTFLTIAIYNRPRLGRGTSALGAILSMSADSANGDPRGFARGRALAAAHVDRRGCRQRSNQLVRRCPRTLRSAIGWLAL